MSLVQFEFSPISIQISITEQKTEKKKREYVYTAETIEFVKAKYVCEINVFN